MCIKNILNPHLVPEKKLWQNYRYLQNITLSKDSFCNPSLSMINICVYFFQIVCIFQYDQTILCAILLFFFHHLFSVSNNCIISLAVMGFKWVIACWQCLVCHVFVSTAVLVFISYFMNQLFGLVYKPFLIWFSFLYSFASLHSH